ncbi:MAG: type II secretion system minor pseudopilin GspK [Steroidobacteraceae bacterium]
MALLTAVLLVAIGTIIAASLGYETALTARRGQGTMDFGQGILAAQAAEAMAAYALRKSIQQDSSEIDLAQPWSQPYGPVELAPGISLQASLEDLQGRFNLNDLVNAAGVIDRSELQAFENLLGILGLESKWGPLIADWIDADSIVTSPDGAEDSTYLSQDPPYRAANRQLTSASALLALPGFGPDRYAKIAPYVTALPQGTAVNICTASGPLLDALAPGNERQWSEISPQDLAKQRARGCFPTVQAYDAPFANSPGSASSVAMTSGDVGTKSQYFRLTSIVDVGNAEFYLYSLLHIASDGRIAVIQRSFTTD